MPVIQQEHGSKAFYLAGTEQVFYLAKTGPLKEEDNKAFHSIEIRQSTSLCRNRTVYFLLQERNKAFYFAETWQDNNSFLQKLDNKIFYSAGTGQSTLPCRNKTIHGTMPSTWVVRKVSFPFFPSLSNCPHAVKIGGNILFGIAATRNFWLVALPKQMRRVVRQKWSYPSCVCPHVYPVQW